MLKPEQVPDVAIEAAIEEYEAAALSGLNDEKSFAAIIAAAINRWAEARALNGANPAEIVLPLE